MERHAETVAASLFRDKLPYALWGVFILLWCRPEAEEDLADGRRVYIKFEVRHPHCVIQIS